VKTIFIIIMSGLLISACSSKPAKTTNTEKTNKNNVAYNTTEPTTFEEYRKWRKDNDPASEAYADYKDWVIQYRKWKLEQENQ
jgi:hypothetical protein